ncbi:MULTISPECIES: GGDEF domain-containing protein [Pseudomonas]|jgi:diguanylate cyclase (GGDEF)-like protein|uniref:diguanylate cyclase n=1 Tax=Pseudomonas extremorientalis TaxID=169669 RepID=A0A1H0IG70_9PSED|nr:MULTISPECIES: GGDEF domain-containing protein [Pseudomonas]KAB0519880.1 GGDEF domain-containing protein [Pseudomonas extremorientalis]OIN07447.1 diguanylate cyclase [Pseudomonas extremorientalis]QZP19030.1 GGDEF domain-containing protein [Pseudomonas sp. DR208]UUN91312.1 GGDEF domain-containing protein [Pseudomonas extremorientalis]WLG59422.1 GGDEF domain-containing protein [Pseudomonas extremorientalis]
MAPLSWQSNQANLMNGLGRGQDQDCVIEEQVRTDRLHQLFRQSFSAIFGSYLGAIMLSWLCWDRFDHQVILVWLLALAASTLLRLKMFMEWFRCPNAERTPDRWERRYWITLMLSAGIWGFGALAVMPTDDRLSQALVMLFTVGMSVSAVSCYSAYRYMTLGSMGLVLFPCTLWLLFQPSPMQIGVAIAVLVFSTFVVSATRKLSDALEKAFRLTRQMERAHNISTRAAQTDELTGLMNRRAFFEHAQVLYEQCRHNRQPLCALMMDMDHFKEINDTYGHQAGDQVLRQIGGVISASFRQADVYGRLGGEEFAVLLPNTSLETARAIAEQLIKAISSLSSAPVHGLTASLGVASTHAQDQDLHGLMNTADKALYRAKALGRNQVAVAE